MAHEHNPSFAIAHHGHDVTVNTSELSPIARREIDTLFQEGIEWGYEQLFTRLLDGALIASERRRRHAR